MAIKKRVLSIATQQLLREVLQTATIAALMDSRRWEPGDIAFQGGTSLHLAHGCARFSEDLYFMVRGSLALAGLSKAVQKNLRLPPDIPADLSVTVTPSKDERNPHMCYVTLSGPQVVGSAKVKVELWQAEAAALKSLQLKVSTVKSPAGQAFVPTLTLDEILADKVYALGARARIKPRDIFDLTWLGGKGLQPLAVSALRTRLAIYPAPSGLAFDTANAWLASAEQRLQDLQAADAAKDVASDLQRWLPSSWPMTESIATHMLANAITQLQLGMRLMRSIVQTLGTTAAKP